VAVVALAACGVCAMVVLSRIPELRDTFLMTGGRTFEEYGTGRVQGWLETVQYMISHPHNVITGIGLGNFKFYLCDYVGLNAAHNNYLHWFVEGGIIGLLVPLVLFWRLGRLLWIGGTSSSFGREVSRVFLALLGGLLAGAVVQESFTPGVAIASFPAYFAFLCGCVVAFYRTTWLQTARH